MPAAALATGRATLAGQVEGDGPDKRGYPGPPGWELSDWPATSPRKKTKTAVKSQGNETAYIWTENFEENLRPS